MKSGSVFFLQNSKNVSFFATKSEKSLSFFDKIQKTIRCFLLVHNFSSVFSNMCAKINQVFKHVYKVAALN